MQAYPPESPTTRVLTDLEGMGSVCERNDDVTHVCRMSSFVEAKYTYWFFDAVVAQGRTLEKREYEFVTTIKSSAGRVKSIDVNMLDIVIE